MERFLRFPNVCLSSKKLGPSETRCETELLIVKSKQDDSTNRPPVRACEAQVRAGRRPKRRRIKGGGSSEAHNARKTLEKEKEETARCKREQNAAKRKKYEEETETST